MLLFGKISRCLAPLYALMILVSSMSYTIDFHYCQGQLKSYSLFGKAKNCHEMAEKMASCHHHKKEDSKLKGCTEDKNCCNNETVYFESDNDQLLIVFNDFNLNIQDFVVATNSNSYTDIVYPVEKEILNVHYKPPLIQKDLPILFESFLL